MSHTTAVEVGPVAYTAQPSVVVATRRLRRAKNWIAGALVSHSRSKVSTPSGLGYSIRLTRGSFSARVASLSTLLL